MEELLRNRKSGWEEISEEEKEKIFKFTDEYIEFMNSAKTEREIVKKTEEIVRKNGFKSLEEYSELYPGDKVYYINREKNIYIAVIGEENLEGGINIVGAHADSPRLDLNQIHYIKMETWHI